MKDNMPPNAPFKSPVSQTLLHWTDLESTNAAWSLRNPWVIAGIVVLAVVLLCSAGFYLLDLPEPARVTLSAVSSVAFFGYLAATFIFQLRAKRTASAVGTLFIILVTVLLLLV